ncbi:MAG TPA: glycoside hydrolase family 44 protein, partial [Gemmataceae bacterium]|nr:glycoside hydrolase family 44 protein [Gemmataceae bacterium]
MPRLLLLTAALALLTAGLSFAGKSPSARFKSADPYRATARVAVTRELHRISDGIYGVCGLPRAKRQEYGIPITRWGGNPSSRYNWRLNVDNGASDWYFKNRGQPRLRPSDAGYVKHILDNQAIGATTYQTIPMLGWVAKDDHSYGFSVAKYGPQKATEPGYPDVGNGVRPDGSFVTGNDPRDTSVEAPPEFIEEGVRFVVKRAGRADAKGVKYWVLDNEPMLWHVTHRDVHPKGCSYEELWDRTVRYAEAIKRADPTAKVAGFCSWGWMDLYFSGLDQGKDNYKTKPDWQAHDKVGLAEWFLQKCADYKKQHGKPLVDVFDVHWYPQGEVNGQGVYLGRGMDPALNELRMRSTRDLWDPTYQQESWIRKTGHYSPVALLRRVRKWIDAYNPGMELCLGEYNFGGSDNITGGLAQAEAFGRMAEQRLDLAFIWYAPEGTQELAWKLFRSYDGKRGRFGDRLLEGESDSPDLSVFPARRGSDNAVTVAVVNKNMHSPCEL